MTSNLTEQIKNFHPLHSALLGSAVFVGTNNAMYALGAAVGSYVYMANFGHGLPSLGDVGTTTTTQPKPATAQLKVTPLFHRMEFTNPYQASDYALHIKYEPGMGSVM